MDAQGNKRRTLVIMEHTLQELAYAYKMSKYRLRRRIKKFVKIIGEREGHFYETEQVREILRLIPPPSDLDIV